MTQEEIIQLANLVKIDINADEATKLSSGMDSILGYIDQIQNVDTKEIELNHSTENPSLREDILQITDFKNDFMQNVPDKEGDYVKVPKVLNTD